LILIENRTPLRPTGVKASKQNFALVLVSICPNESAQDGFQACMMTGTRVLLGREALLDPKHRQYFRQCIEPLVQQNARNGLPHYRYPEPLNEEPMQRRLARANCLLHFGVRAGVSRAVQLNWHRPQRGAAAGGSIWLAA